MRRPALVLAASLSGGALALLAYQLLIAHPLELEITTAPRAVKAAPLADVPLDLSVAMEEITNLRCQRGAVFAGTSLADDRSQQEFQVVLAEYLGVEAPPDRPAGEDDVDIPAELMRAARLFQRCSERCEQQQQYFYA